MSEIIISGTIFVYFLSFCFFYRKVVRQIDKDELKRLQEQMYEDMIEVPEQLESAINDLSEHLGKQLVLKQKEKVRFEFLDNTYTVIYRKDVVNFREVILMVIVNETEINPNTNMPRVFNVNAEVDNDLSPSENLRAIMASFLRDQIGTLRAELMEE